MLCRQLRRGLAGGWALSPPPLLVSHTTLWGGGQLGWGGGQQTFPTMADAMILLKLYNVATWLAGTRVAESRLIP